MVVVARVLAGLQAVFYAVLWFGVVDLLTPFVQDEAEWRSSFLLETGWGLLFSVLVAVPYAVLAARPGHASALGTLALAAVALVLGGLWAGALPQVLNGLAVGLGAALVGLLGHGLMPARRAADPVLAALAGVGLCGALALGWQVVEDSAVLGDVTNGVDHRGVQASLGLAVAAAVALSAVTTARLPAWSAATCAAWLAGVSLAYPDVDGSLGTPGAIATLAWAALVVTRLVRPGR